MRSGGIAMLARVALLLTAGLWAGCDRPGGGKPDGGGPGADGGGPAGLTLSASLAGPSLAELAIDGGKLELKQVSLYGDVAADARTMVSKVNLELPNAAHDYPLPSAPYGLYSRVRAGIDELDLDGSWRGAKLHIHLTDDDFEEGIGVDLRVPAVDYSTTQDAKFALAIDGTAWFDAALLDAALLDGGELRIDRLHNFLLIPAIRTAVRASFSVTTTTTPSTTTTAATP